ncbi:transglutaminase domain-containing protein [uncultured Tenacibaculum sp.]|uniref:transglutaminase domain-containing protein n=1 Tax=uncultured Tenacibaculum sp. TaxID=174713 RepID=UPI0026101238|nr:transglutaminase domain-containing protein [uncultured Tenacibaculum sp.]
MKKILLILFFCLSNQLSFSQDFKKVDQIIKYYPEIQTIEQLAQKINYDFKNSNLEKVRAIYTWIGLNIKYDYMLFNSSLLRHPEFIAYNDEHDLDWIKRRKIKEVAQSTFEARKGLCTGYAYLFQRICNLMDIPNELIYGYTRTSFRDIGYIPKTKNHVWNSVKIDNRWLLMDLTFGSGYMYKDVWQKKFNQDYFDASKDFIKLTHFATDSKWNTYLDQKNLQEFCLDPFFKNAYLKSNIEIIKPTVGEIVINKKEKIRLSIKKLPNVDNIRYSYLHDDKIYDARIDNKQEQTTDIYFKNPKRDTSLHIYINNELALEYKVKIL